MKSFAVPLDALRAVLGPRGVLTDPTDLAPFLSEQRGLFRGSAAAVLRPASTDQAVAAVRLCAQAGVPMTPVGGNTGLVGGGVPDGGVVISTARLNRIRDLDPLNHTVTAEAGCVLATVQAAADDAGCLFPLSLAAEGSCHVGGNLATNAGGTAVLRYGTTRDLVLGLEVVLPDGRLWDGLRTLRKDNTGYDLKHLFVGAEGTLGLITAAVFKLFPRPRQRETALAACDSADSLLALFHRAFEACGDALTAFEMVPRLGLEFACRHVEGVIDPFAVPHPLYALVELASPRVGDGLREALEGVLADAFESGVVVDAVLADSEARRAQLWRLRESIPEAQKHEGGSIKHDVSVPLSRLPAFLERATAAVEAAMPGVRVCAFGHVGDGNVHFNLSQPIGMDTAAFLDHWTGLNRVVHDIAVELDGSFSAEHGIGRLKLDDLTRYTSAVEIDLMRHIKAAFDPRGLMNPGKVLG